MITFVHFRQGWPSGRPGPEGGVDHSAQSAYDSARSFSGEATGTAALIVVDHRALLIRPLACFLAFRTPWPGASAWPLTSDQRPRPRVRVRVSAQAVRRGVRHQAGARGGHHPAVDLHQVIPVTADVGRSCRQASAPVLQASAGEVPTVGNVSALGVGDQPAQSSQGAGKRPQVRSRGHWNRHRPWRLSDPRQILVQHFRALGAIVTVYIATVSVRCKQRS